MDLVLLAWIIGSVEAVMIGVFIYQVNIKYKDYKISLNQIKKWK